MSEEENNSVYLPSGRYMHKLITQQQYDAAAVKRSMASKVFIDCSLFPNAYTWYIPLEELCDKCLFIMCDMYHTQYYLHNLTKNALLLLNNSLTYSLPNFGNEACF